MRNLTEAHGNPTSPNSCVRERDSRHESLEENFYELRRQGFGNQHATKERKKAGHFSATAAPQVVTTLTATLTQQCGSSKRDG